jgi:hypothetical protein
VTAPVEASTPAVSGFSSTEVLIMVETKSSPSAAAPITVVPIEPINVTPPVAEVSEAAQEATTVAAEATAPQPTQPSLADILAAAGLVMVETCPIKQQQWQANLKAESTPLGRPRPAAAALDQGALIQVETRPR